MLTACYKTHSSVTRLGNKEVTEGELKPDVCYWQIAAVKEYFSRDELVVAAPKLADGSDSPATGARKAQTAAQRVKLATASQKRNSLLLLTPEIPSATNMTIAAAPAVPWEVRMTKWERKVRLERSCVCVRVCIA